MATYKNFKMSHELFFAALLLARICLCQVGVGRVTTDTPRLPTTTSPCSDQKVHDCVVPLNKYNLNDPFFPQLTRRELSDMCSEYQTAEDCVRSFRVYCDLYQRRHYESLESAYDYICGDGFEIYLGNYDCYGLENLRQRVYRCNNTLQSDRLVPQEEVHDNTREEQFEEICKHLNTYMYCIRDTIADRCGDEAGDWQLEVNKRSIQRVLNEMDCVIGKPLLTPGEIAGVVIGCLVFIIIVVVIVYYCTCNVWRYRKKQEAYQSEKLYPNRPAVIPSNHPQKTTARKTHPGSVVKKKSSLKQVQTPQSTARTLPANQETARSTGTPMATRLKLNLSFADDLDNTGESLSAGRKK